MSSPELHRPPVVLAAPSGSGKTTIARALVEREADFAFSVSATTRPPREGEVHGQDYHFLTREAFQKMVQEGAFAEWAEVHGDLYGTPLASLSEAGAGHRYVVLDIDVQGAFQIREAVPQALLLFILPPSVEVLFSRLTGRGTEGEERIRRRLTTALKELEAAASFDFLVINDELEPAIREVRDLVRRGETLENRDAGEGSRGSGTLEHVRKLEEGIEALLRKERLLENS